MDHALQNVESVRPLGVSAVHLPAGLSEEAWKEVQAKYQQKYIGVTELKAILTGVYKYYIVTIYIICPKWLTLG